MIYIVNDVTFANGEFEKDLIDIFSSEEEAIEGANNSLEELHDGYIEHWFSQRNYFDGVAIEYRRSHDTINRHFVEILEAQE